LSVKHTSISFSYIQASQDFTSIVLSVVMYQVGSRAETGVQLSHMSVLRSWFQWNSCWFAQVQGRKQSQHHVILTSTLFLHKQKLQHGWDYPCS